FRLARCQAQAGQEQFSVLRISVQNNAWNYDRSERTQSFYDFSRFVESSHMSVARCEKLITDWQARTLFQCRLPVEIPHSCAPHPTSGKARIEGEGAVDRTDRDIDVLSKRSQHYGSIGEDVWVIRAQRSACRAKSMPSRRWVSGSFVQSLVARS